MCWATDGGSVWEAVPGQAARQVLAAQERWIEAAFAPSGTALLARTDREVQSWNLESGAVKRSAVVGPFGYGLNARMPAYGADGIQHVYGLSAHRLVLVGGDGLAEIECTSSCERIGYSPRGDVLVGEHQSGQVKLWSVPGGMWVGTFPAPSGVGASAISADCTLLAVGTLGQGGDGSIRPIAVWDIATQRQVATLSGHTRQVQALAFSRDRRWIVSASLDRTVRLWPLDGDADAEPPEVARLAYDDLEFASLHVLSDGRILVFRRSGLEIWRELHELVLCVPAPHPFDCRWRVSSDERRLVVSFGMQRVGVWSLDDGLFLGWAEADIPRPEPLFNAALLQQVQPTASGALWRGQDGTYLHLGDGPRGWITPLACSADRRMMILPCRSGAALIEFDPEPRLLQVIPFNGRLRASCITATEAMVVNGAGSIVQSPRMDASLDA